MKLIPLTQGQFAIVDDADFKRLVKMNWHTIQRYGRSKTCYAGTNVRKDGRKVILRMHHCVLGLCGVEVDHKNGNGLDNRRKNLRVATHKQNGANLAKQKNRTSEFKGVSWSKNADCWEAYICPNGVKRHLGLFLDEADAARAYDRAAKHHFRLFARLNFP